MVGLLTPAEFSEEMKSLMYSYAGGALFERHVVEIVALSEYYETWFLPEFMDLVAGAIASIPEPHRADALVELSEARLEIRWSRPETDDESNLRVENAAAYAWKKTETERVEYERLRAKFGD